MRDKRQEGVLVNTKLLGADGGMNLAKRTEIDSQKRIVSRQTKGAGTLRTKKL